MPLTRFNTKIIWDGEAKDADAMTDPIDVSKVSHLGVYFHSNVANTLKLYVRVKDTYLLYESWPVEAGENFWLNIWSFPYGEVEFSIESAATVTLIIYYKT